MRTRPTFLFICASLIAPMLLSASQGDMIRIGSKRFTESHILATLSQLLLESRGMPVTMMHNVGAQQGPRELLQQGHIDIYWEYTGTAQRLYGNPVDARVADDPDQLFQNIRAADLPRGLVWLAPARFNNPCVLFVRRDWAMTHRVATMSDLAQWLATHTAPGVIVTPLPYYHRPDGLRRWLDAYRISLPRAAIKLVHSFTSGYRLVQAGHAFAAVGFNTNGEFLDHTLLRLQDDRHFLPAYHPAPVVRADVIDQFPQMGKVLDALGPLLTEEEIMRLNYDIDINGQPLVARCRRWLAEKGLIRAQ